MEFKQKVCKPSPCCSSVLWEISQGLSLHHQNACRCCFVSTHVLHPCSPLPWILPLFLPLEVGSLELCCLPSFSFSVCQFSLVLPFLNSCLRMFPFGLTKIFFFKYSFEKDSCVTVHVQNQFFLLSPGDGLLDLESWGEFFPIQVAQTLLPCLGHSIVGTKPSVTLILFPVYSTFCRESQNLLPRVFYLSLELRNFLSLYHDRSIISLMLWKDPLSSLLWKPKFFFALKGYFVSTAHLHVLCHIPPTIWGNEDIIK